MKDSFIGRQTKLEALQEKFNKDSFGMAVIYGRRRIGKTTLINKFIENNKCKAISFVGTERDESELLKMMSEAAVQVLAPELAGNITFESFEKLFDFIGKAALKERIIFVIDEYPYLAKECPYMNSVLQKYIDHDWKSTKLFFILLGSLVSFMEEKVLANDAPLHGRSDLQFKLKPFGYLESGLFVPSYNEREKAVVYGLTGGVAKHLIQFNDTKSIDENIEKLFFSETAYFTEEQIKTLITSDKANPTAYNSIIMAMANGKTKFNEIANSAKMDDITFYMRNLISSGIIEKRSSPKPYYIICDPLINFYFHYVSPALSVINAGNGKIYYQHNVKNLINEHMGKVFESMSRDYILRNVGTNKVPAFVTDVIEYQNSFKTDKGIKSVEIDLLGVDDKNYVLAGECKFKSEKFDRSDLENFLGKIKYIPSSNVKIMLFSLSGFSDYVMQNGKDYKLVDIKQMYK